MKKMKKMKSIKIIAILLCVATLFGLVSCSGGKTNEPEMAIVDHVYRSKTLELPENYSSSYNSLNYKDGRIHMLCSVMTDEENYKYKTVKYSIDVNGENPESSDFELSENSYVNRYIITPDGGSMMLLNSYNDETQESKTLLMRYDADGNELGAIDIFPLFSNQGEDSEYGGRMYISNIAVDNDGNIIAASDYSIIAVSPDGNKLFELEINGYVNNMNIAGNGKVFIQYYDRTNYEQVIKYIDVAKKGFGADLTLPATSINSYFSYFVGEGYDLYLRDDTGLYAFNEGDTELTYLCNWVNSDILPNTTNTISIISPDKFMTTGYDDITNKQIIQIMTKVPDEEVTPKYLINLSGFSFDYMLPAAVVKFNRENEKYRVVMNEYSKYSTEDNYMQGSTVLNNEIISGKVPDILICDAYSTPYQSYNKKGMFVDLYEYMDNDHEFPRDKLLQCVRTPFENDGKLYQFVTGFGVATMAGKTELVGSDPHWTFDEMLATLEKMPEGTALMELTTKSDMLMIMVILGMKDYYNLDTGTCDFDNDYFKRILTYANTLSDEYDYSMYERDDRYSDYRENKVLVTNTSISSFDEIMRLQVMFGNEPLTFKGYPTSSGSGTTIMASASYSIAKNSPVKDGAWAFLKFIAQDDMLVNDWNYGFPGTVSGFNKYAEDEKKNEWEFHLSGGYSKGAIPAEGEENSYGTSTYSTYVVGEGYMMNGSGSESGVKKRLTQADIDTAMALFNTVDSSANYEQKMMEIITEEAQMFFEGDKSVDETTKVIQSRISIYISENY